MKIIQVNGKDEISYIQKLKEREAKVDKEVNQQVQHIIDDVKLNQDVAVMEYTKKFDGCIPETIEVTKEQIQEALNQADPTYIKALKKAIKNIETFHKRQIQQSYLDTQVNGTILGQTIRGLSKVGIYVPGGTAAYPSSVLMNAIPAKIANVKEIIMVMPPLKDGTANPDCLVAAYLCGVNRIFLIGGAQAIAALAYGTKMIPRVDKIVGPGNKYVATAKQLLYGVVDIDMIAGPSEILVIADEKANPSYIAADLMSQAEHDLLASAILVTTSLEIANQTKKEIEKQIQKLSRKEMIKESLLHYGAIFVCNTLDEAIDLANYFAPEHLEVLVEEPLRYLGRLENAGSIFLGPYSPEPVGDYFAGTNHVLPTSGTARFFSPLSVDSFIKKSSFIYYSQKALKEAAEDIILLANKEQLSAHAASIEVRFEKEVHDNGLSNK